MILEFIIKKDKEEPREEKHKEGRYNFAKTDFNKLRMYFKNCDWVPFEQAVGVHNKWRIFREVYDKGINQFVPKIKGKTTWIKPWYNIRCAKAKRNRDEAWNRWKKKRTTDAGIKYKLARNEYVRIRREEERNFEKDIVEKCKDQPKLFYKFVNGRLKEKQSIERLRLNGTTYYDPNEQAEIMNKSFESVFTKEREMVNEEGKEREKVLRYIDLEVQEVRKLLEDLDVRKALGPDSISNWVLKECREELLD